MTNQSSTIGRRVRSAREGLELSQWDLAKRSGVTTTTISRTECGSITPKLPTLERIATGLGCRVTDLLNGDDGHAHHATVMALALVARVAWELLT